MIRRGKRLRRRPWQELRDRRRQGIFLFPGLLTTGNLFCGFFALLLSADSDDRVDPMHARKFAALLQNASSGGPVLLRIEQNAGHGGADRIQSLVEQRADSMAFALAELGRAR